MIAMERWNCTPSSCARVGSAPLVDRCQPWTRSLEVQRGVDVAEISARTDPGRGEQLRGVLVERPVLDIAVEGHLLGSDLHAAIRRPDEVRVVQAGLDGEGELLVGIAVVVEQRVAQQDLHVDVHLRRRRVDPAGGDQHRHTAVRGRRSPRPPTASRWPDTAIARPAYSATKAATPATTIHRRTRVPLRDCGPKRGRMRSFCVIDSATVRERGMVRSPAEVRRDRSCRTDLRRQSCWARRAGRAAGHDGARRAGKMEPNVSYR